MSRGLGEGERGPWGDRGPTAPTELHAEQAGHCLCHHYSPSPAWATRLLPGEVQTSVSTSCLRHSSC